MGLCTAWASSQPDEYKTQPCLFPQTIAPTTCASHLNEAGLPPAVKFALKNDLVPLPAGQATYTLTMRIPASLGACADLRTMCGGGSCMMSLADSSYKNCPAYYTAAP